MGDRHGYGPRYSSSRPRSPIMHSGRNSMPNVGYNGYLGGGYGETVYPARDFITQPRSSTDRLTPTVPTTTTKYRVVPSSIDAQRSSSLRSASRNRSATIDSSGRSVVISQAPRQVPLIHHPVVTRPASPLSNPYRSSTESAYLVPASSHHHHHHRGHHRNRYSIDGGSGYRTKNRDWDISRGSGGRENAAYINSRGRPAHNTALVTASDDYMDGGYSYTTPREVVKYELEHSAPRHTRTRRESDSARSRPASITGVTDLGGAKSYDARERGPPPTTRHRDKIPPTTRTSFDLPSRSRADLAYESDSRGSRKQRPVSMYQEVEPRIHRDEIYSHSRQPDMRERAPREKSHHQSRHDESDRGYGSEKHHGEKKEHRGRDALAATLAAAAGALGLGAVGGKDDRDDRDEPSRRSSDNSDEEPRRRRREDKDPAPVDLGGRNPREKTHSGDGRRGSPQYDRDPRASDGEYKRESREKHGSESPPREKRSSPPISSSDEKSKSRHSRPRSRSGSNNSSDAPSDKDRGSRREKERSRAEPPTPTTPSAAFNPNNTMDLRALKEQLNRQEEPREPVPIKRSSASVAATTNSRDDRERQNLIDETPPPKDLRDPEHIRVVSPPRETQVAKQEEKPIKGILRPPRDKFPEDPTHIREGVAPLKDAQKGSVPPHARWTKISRSMVNPAALEAGKERYEEQGDHVIVLRVLSKDEIQQYATITESIRAKREDEEREYQRRRRRERHERHKRERAEHHRSSRRPHDGSESDTTEDEEYDREYDRNNDHVLAIEAPETPRTKRIAFGDDNTLMSGGLGDLKENPNAPGTYTGYTRNPPPISR